METLNHHRLSCGPCSRDLQTRYQGRAKHSLTQSPSLTPSGPRALYLPYAVTTAYGDLLRSGGSPEPLMQWLVCPFFRKPTQTTSHPSRATSFCRRELVTRALYPPAFRQEDIRRSPSGEKYSNSQATLTLVLFKKLPREAFETEGW